MNKKVMTILGASFFVLGAFLFYTNQSVVLAADNVSSPVVSPASYKTSVSKISLSKPLYAQGETIKGTFNLVNSGLEAVSDLYYRVTIIGGYDKNGITAQYVYGQSDLQGPLSIGGAVGGGKTVSVPFSYVLPSSVGGSDVGVRIDLLTKQGQSLYWTAARFNISGSMSAVSVQSASIEIGGEFFLPQTGPTIHAGESPSIVVGLSNPLTTTVSLTPKIKIYNRVTTGAPLYTSTSTTAFTISANAKKSVSYPLPLFNNKPGVYAGTIDFVDSAGALRAPTIDFRYIIGGDIATIQSVDTGSGTVAKGQTVNVSVLYSGSPTDTRTLEKTSVGSSTLAVSLFNEKGVLVGQITTSVDVVDTQTKTVGIVALTDARALRADVVLSKDGKVLSNFSTSFVPALNLLPPEPTSFANIGWVLLIIILILLLAFFLRFMKKKNKSIPPSALAILGIIVAGVSLFVAGQMPVARADYIQIPWAPVITGPSSLLTNEAGTFYITYPTTSNVSYGVDSNGGRVPTMWIPAFQSFVSGGTNSSFSLSWPTTGTKTISGIVSVGSPTSHVLTSWQDFFVNILDGLMPVDGTWFGPGGWVLTGYSNLVFLSPHDITATVLSSDTDLSPGENFNLAFGIKAVECSNQYQRVVVRIKTQSWNSSFVGGVGFAASGETYVQTNPQSAGCVGICNWLYTSSEIVTNTYTAPTTPGTYRITFEVVNSPHGALNLASQIGTVYGYKEITVAAPLLPSTPPTVTLVATPSTINSGSSSKLTWTSTNANMCITQTIPTVTLSPAALATTSGSTGVSVSPTVTTTYSISCNGFGNGPENIANSSATVTVLPVGPISSSCSVAPSTGTTGTTYVWTATNPTGGNGTYTYLWSGTGLSGETTRTVSKTYSTPGTYTGSVRVSSPGFTSQPFPCTNSATVGPQVTTCTGSASVLPGDTQCPGTNNYPSPSRDWTYTGVGVATCPTGATNICKYYTPSVLPDLTAGSITPTSATTNVAVTLFSTIHNANASTGRDFWNLLQIDNNTDHSSIIDEISTQQPTALSAGGTATASFQKAFASAGTYYLRVCADKSSTTNTGVINESDETNNCGDGNLVNQDQGWTVVTVTDLPTTCSNGATNPPDCTFGCHGPNCSNGLCISPFVLDPATGTCVDPVGPGGAVSCSPFVNSASGLIQAPFANIGQQVTWETNPVSSGTWSSDPSGAPILHTGSTYSMQYSTIGNKTMYLKVGASVPIACTVNGAAGTQNSLLIVNNPNFHEF